MGQEDGETELLFAKTWVGYQFNQKESNQKESTSNLICFNQLYSMNVRNFLKENNRFQISRATSRDVILTCLKLCEK